MRSRVCGIASEESFQPTAGVWCCVFDKSFSVLCVCVCSEDFAVTMSVEKKHLNVCGLDNGQVRHQY